MRNNIVHPGAQELSYEIREIVEMGKKLEDCGIPMTWENIGDPVGKGEPVPVWIKDIISQAVYKDDSVFAYSPTKGLPATREFISKQRKEEAGVYLDPEDILFFNGLGDAISIIYTYLDKNVRVLGPNPAYPTHSSAEGAHAGGRHLTYNLDPKRNWLPDVRDIRNKVAYNPSVTGLLIINPDNPTGMVYPESVLKEIVSIAREFGLFLISDEIYANIVHGNEKMTPLYAVPGNNVPTIVMRGLSKEVPWPGGRSGWIEVYNRKNDAIFDRYVRTLLDAKRLEVCSTTLPQAVLPEILSHPEYKRHLSGRAAVYGKKATIAQKIFSKVPGVLAPRPDGSFYFSVVFEDGVLNNRQFLPAQNAAAQELIEKSVALNPAMPLDRRFAYYLMGANGICVVPLSGFNSSFFGFRLTLLEPDEREFEETLKAVAESVEKYLKSA